VTASPRADRSSDYYPWFDWLRIVLAGAVMLSHDGLLDFWPAAGNFAVEVFFALSGWLIGGILLKTSTSQLPHFYFNRAARIWCPYYLALALLVAASLMHDTVTHKWLEFVAYKATFVYNWFGPPQLDDFRAQMPLQGTGNHFWSVNAEEQFYLVAPLLLVLAPARYGRSILAWIALAVAAWWTQTFASIVFGVLAAAVAIRRPTLFTELRSRLVLGALLIASVAGMAAGWTYELMAPFCSISVVLLLAIKGAQHPGGQFAGGMSYPLYLNHWIGLAAGHSAVKRFGLTDASFMRHAGSIVLSLALAALLYWFVDRKILKARPRFYTPQLGRAAMVGAYLLVGVGLCIGLLVNV
jgi:peptidoglycan/LPS O-acetylase OafA/YrhL